MNRTIAAVRAVALLIGAVLIVWRGATAADAVLLHGFAPMCADGNPEYDPEFCGITWRPGFPHLAGAALGLALVVVSIWTRVFTHLLLIACGGSFALLAVLLLWGYVWVPATPAHPEPAGPQLVLLALGLAAVLVGLVLQPRPAASLEPSPPAP